LANLLNEVRYWRRVPNKKAVGRRKWKKRAIKYDAGRERPQPGHDDADKEVHGGMKRVTRLVKCEFSISSPAPKSLLSPEGSRMGRRCHFLKCIWSRRRRKCRDMISVADGGRIAEEIVSGGHSTGAQETFSKLRIWRFAMKSPKGYELIGWGWSIWGRWMNYVFLGREMARAKVYSESVAQQCDGEVKRSIDELTGSPRNLITTNIDKLE